MVLKIAKRGTIPPFIVMDVMRAANERAAGGGEVLHLEIGQPCTDAPAPVLEAAREALGREVLGYTDSFGIHTLRRRIAKHYSETYGVDVDPGRVMVTTGSSGAFVLAFLGAFEAGDRVALASPGYPGYRNILKALDVEPVGLPVGSDSNFQPTPEILERAPGRVDGLIIGSPSNPTGTMIHRDLLEALVGYCGEKGIRLISDEIYHGITYGQAAETALAFTDDAMVINSFSKYFSMTGWRLGWMVFPERLSRSMECLGTEPLHIPPDPVPVRRRHGLRLPR